MGFKPLQVWTQPASFHSHRLSVQDPSALREGRSGKCKKDGGGDSTLFVLTQSISLWLGKDTKWRDGKGSLLLLSAA